MTHFRSMLDAEHMGAWDLDGDRVVTIAKVDPGTVGGQKGRKKEKKAILHFREFPRPMICNVTNAKAIAGMYGVHVEKWIGKRITIYPTTTTFGADTVDCIRVRPTVPSGEGERFEGKPVDREMREQQERAARKAEHPAAPLAAAKNADELLEAITTVAPWVHENHKVRWPKVLERCAELGVSESDADLALELASGGL